MTIENTNSSDNTLIGKIPSLSKIRNLTAEHVEKSKKLEIDLSRLEIREAFERWEKKGNTFNGVFLRNVPPIEVQRELKEMGYTIDIRHSDFAITW
jgi:hypothetical protein